MAFDRAEIRKAENGYIVNVSHRSERQGKGGDVGPDFRSKDHVAPSDGHALKIIKHAMGKCDEASESPKDETKHSKKFLQTAMSMKDKRKAKAVGGKKRGMKR